MFGFIYLLGTAIGSVVSGTKGFISNCKARQEGEIRYLQGNNIERTYYDRKGIQRDLDTDKIASVRSDVFDMCDDEYLWLDGPGVKTRNISAEKRELDFLKGKKGNWYGRTADLYDARSWTKYGSNKYKVQIKGSFYHDLRSNDIYVCREFELIFNKNKNKFVLYNGQSRYDDKFNCLYRTCKFYMNIETGLLVRKADTQLESEKKFKSNYDLTDDEAKSFINSFNKSQKSGGWYKSDDRIGVDKTLKKQQDFYCNDLCAEDHIYNLIKLQGK